MYREIVNLRKQKVTTGRSWREPSRTYMQYEVLFECGHSRNWHGEAARPLARLTTTKTVRAWCHDCCTELAPHQWSMVRRLCEMMMGGPVPNIEAETLLALRMVGWSLGQVYGAPSCDWWRAVLQVAQAEQGTRTKTQAQALDEARASLWRSTWAELAALEQRGWLAGCKPLPTFEAWEGLKSWAPESKTPIVFGGVHILEEPKAPKARARKVKEVTT